MKISRIPSCIRQFVVVGGAAIFCTTPSFACSDSPLVGSVCYMASNFCPSGYLNANGQIVAIQQYNILYSLLATTYGGDGKNNFALPDLRGRSVIGWGAATAQTTTVPFGNKRGAEGATLTATQVPQHTHPATFTGTGDGTVSVNIPATSSTLAVTANLPVGITTPASGGATPATGSNYLTAIAGSTGSGVSTSAVTFKGPYTGTKPGAGSTLPIDVSVTGNAATAAQSVTLPTAITGGTVAVNANAGAAQVSVPTLPPQQALTACIAYYGTYPTRD